MKIFITGVSCVGKTAVGAQLANLLGYNFFDLDQETEKFFKISIERLQNKFLTIHSYRDEAAKALEHVLKKPESKDCVIAMPPSGLMGGYLRVLKKIKRTVIVLADEPDNILDRIRFYDIDSRLIEKQLSKKENRLYLKEIKKDITYFRTSYSRADFQVDLCGLDVAEAAVKVAKLLESIPK